MRSLRVVLASALVVAVALARTRTGLAPGVWPTWWEQALHAGLLGALATVAGVVGAALAGVLGSRADLVDRLAVGLAWGVLGAVALLPLAATVVDGFAATLAVLGLLATVAASSAAFVADPRGRALTALVPAVWGVAQVVPALRVPSSPPDRPTVVLVTLDTARADAFDLCAEAGDGRSPVLAGLAARGRTFCRAFATNPLTGPSHASMLTGRLSPDHGVWRNGQRLPAIETVATRLRAAGWTTAAVVSASVLDSSLGFDQGFDAFDGTLDGRLARAWALFRDLGFVHHPGSAEQRTGAMTFDLLAGRVPARGAFVWVHLYDLHWPYAPGTTAAVAEGVTDLSALPIALRRPVPRPDEPPDAATLARGRGLYYAQARDLDATLARLLELLPDDAAVVIVGDHGESLDEHAYPFTHGRLVFGADTWVPLVVVGPGVAPARIEGARSTVDVAATILELAGLPPEIGTSRSLLRDDAGDAWSFAWRETDGRAPGESPDPALDPLAGLALRRGDDADVWWDPGREHRSVRDDPRDVGPSLSVGAEAAAALEAQAEAARATPAPRVEPGRAEGLRALGYVE